MRRLLNPERLEAVALVLILLAVGGMAGAASFTHVKDWTMLHAPHGTGQWFGWANAVISELTPAAALLVIRRRRRADPAASVLYPLSILLAAVALSLAAQIAVANDSFSSRLLSSVPALAFLALSKLVLTGTRPAESPAPVPVKPASAPAAAARPVDLEPVDMPVTPTPAYVPPTPRPAPTPAPVTVPAPVRSALISSVVQTPRNGVVASEVTR
ncbi:hypothetical protein SAMN05444365_102286 [Micromonospora pattaloongensis]|uniref:DUF2637 domain-containing protein n=1 Tax=Micromonospora pattaloongensis TaxID=405436 RepID=A0A1H3JZ57_9ACTN|nr:hypothetical protein [Micromonospora pattaloongensis]SDY44618.1 hypothetical protein SAMN05444365_102286 [Micromonospora pattaloongensis]